jgi:DNA-binding transcriptional MerR regulator
MEAAEFAIPDQRTFKASQVCEIARIQPYVLRSWESEFPDLGVSKTAGGPRLYRRADVERVLQIRQLVFDRGLTLSGVRRQLEGDAPAPAETPEVSVEEEAWLDQRGLRQALSAVKRGLRDLLDDLERPPQAGEFTLAPSSGSSGSAGKRRSARRVVKSAPDA